MTNEQISKSNELKFDGEPGRSITDIVCGEVIILKGGKRLCKNEDCPYGITSIPYSNGRACDVKDYENAANKTTRTDLSGYDTAVRANPLNGFVDPEAKNKSVWDKRGN